MDPKALAELPIVALLILIGVAIFGLLLRGELRFKREVDNEREEKIAYKGIATQMTAVNAQQAVQISQLTETLERMVPKVAS